jgi:hypothetical protein
MTIPNENMNRFNVMNILDELREASTSSGRILLHLSAMQRDHRWIWHLAGIKREVRRIRASAELDYSRTTQLTSGTERATPVRISANAI